MELIALAIALEAEAERLVSEHIKGTDHTRALLADTAVALRGVVRRETTAGLHRKDVTA